MKIIIDNYTFDHSAHTVTFTDYVSIVHARIMLVANVTREVILYQFANNTGLGGTVSGNVLTLTYNTGSQADGDHLLVIYDDPAVASSTAANQATEIASLASINTKTPALGQALAAASVPVILPAATITTLTPQTNALTDAQLRASAVPVSAATLPLPTGASTETTLGTRLSESDFDTKTGSLTETAPATDTASSGVNGRLQRIAQRLTTLIATVGDTTGAAVVTDANGTLQQYLRGIVKLIIAKIGVTIADGDSATLGITTGAAVVTDTTGTIQQYIRGLNKALVSSVWNSANNWLQTRNYQVDIYAASVAFTISLNSLASSTAGVGRQSTLLTSNTNRAAMVGVKLKTGTTPTANSSLSVYLIQGDGTINTDSAGPSDAGLTVVNAKLLGVLNCSVAVAGTIVADIFDTRLVTPALGPTWGIAIVNSSGAALDASAGGTIEYSLVS